MFMSCFLDLADDINQLNYNYWTGLSRLGCSGKIKNCFSNKTDKDKYETVDAIFWSIFDRTENGACVALQTMPLNSDSAFEKKMNFLGPVFRSCGSLNYLACEGSGPKSNYLAEAGKTVKQKTLCSEG